MDTNTILTAIGTAILTSGIFGLAFKTFLTEKITARIKSDYDHKLEGFKTSLSDNSLILSTVITSQNQSYQLGHTQTLESIKTYWANLLIVKNCINVIIKFDAIYTKDEFEKLFTPLSPANDIQEKELIIGISAVKLESLINTVPPVEAIRPFLNEKLFGYFILHHTFFGRVYMSYQNGVTIKRLNHWKNDSMTKKMFEVYLTPEQTSTIYNSTSNGLAIAQSIIEQLILSELSNIISGKSGAKFSMENALQIAEITRNFTLKKL